MPLSQGLAYLAADRAGMTSSAEATASAVWQPAMGGIARSPTPPATSAGHIVAPPHRGRHVSR